VGRVNFGPTVRRSSIVVLHRVGRYLTEQVATAIVAIARIADAAYIIPSYSPGGTTAHIGLNRSTAYLLLSVLLHSLAN